MEIWKDIAGYEGLYQVSSYGRVRNSEGEILKQRLDHNGYYMINLSNKGTKKTHKVHRLVGIAFIENPNNLPEINHRDECSKNNHAENLEWCDRQYNNSYGHRPEKMSVYMKEHAPKGKDNYFYGKRFLGADHARSKRVLQLDNNGNVLATFECTRSAAESVNCSPSAIGLVCRGKRLTAKGYKWKYEATN